MYSRMPWRALYGGWQNLVCQLIDAEYPQLYAEIGAFKVNIWECNEKSFEHIVQRSIWRHIGFRWIVEALIGGDLTELPNHLFGAVHATLREKGQLANQTIDEYATHLKLRLKTRRPILVGQDLFIALIYLYRNFIGPLPDKLTDFRSIMHELCPTMVDLSYMASSYKGTSGLRSLLAETRTGAAGTQEPRTIPHHQHHKYISTAPPEENFNGEAGYRSMIAAEVFVRFPNKLKDPTSDAQSDNKRECRTSPDGNTDEVPAPDTCTNQSIEVIPGCLLRSEETMALADSGRLLPRTAESWRTYSNKLAMSGTDPALCSLI
ncbi:hypothetical protein BDV59DRAFT_180479 [Aspergillus ambiguus]|uniref:CAF1 family ribonuclease n=1 Tax=Aspergillus ambiguus TaxID=176160 RepID=UPI003CCC9081